MMVWNPDKRIDQIVGSLRRFGLGKKDVVIPRLLSPDQVKAMIKKNGFDPGKIDKLLIDDSDISFLD